MNVLLTEGSVVMVQHVSTQKGLTFVCVVVAIG